MNLLGPNEREEFESCRLKWKPQTSLAIESKLKLLSLVEVSRWTKYKLE